MPGASEVKAGGAYVEIGAKTKQLDRALAGVRTKMQNLGTNFVTMGRRFLVVGAAMAAPLVIAAKYAAEQEKAENALASALKAHGDEAEMLMPKLKALASAIQEQTIMGDEAVLMLMAQIRNLGIMPQNLDKATKGAIGLAKALGLDANAAARYTALALQGETTILQRYVPALRTATTAAEKQAIVTELMEKGFSQAAAESETFGGRLQQLKNTAGDLAEDIGMELIPKLTQMAERAREWVKIAREYVGENKQLVTAYAKLTVAVLAVGAAFVTTGFALKAFAFLLSPTSAIVAAAVTGLILLLDYLGLVDTGIQDIAKNFGISADKIKLAWEIVTASLKALWWGFAEAVLKVLKQITDNMALMIDSITNFEMLPDYIKEGLRGAAAEMKKWSQDIVNIATGKKEQYQKEMAEKGLEIVEAYKKIRLRLTKEGGPLDEAIKETAVGAPAAAAGAVTGGVIGTFSAAASEMLGGPTRIAQDQLNEMKKQTQLQEGILDGVRAGQVAAFG
jgi:hypothetical protein